MSQKNTAGGRPYQRDTPYRKRIAGIIPGFGTNPNALKPPNNSIVLPLIVRFSLVGLISARLKRVDFVKSPITKKEPFYNNNNLLKTTDINEEFLSWIGFSTNYSPKSGCFDCLTYISTRISAVPLSHPLFVRRPEGFLSLLTKYQLVVQL